MVRKIAKEEIQESFYILSPEQQELIRAFYGIERLKERDITKLADIIGKSVYDTENLLIDALNKLNNKSRGM